MTAFVTALRGLRSRWVLSSGSLAVIVLAIAATVLGPMFQQASVQSYTLGRVDQARDTQTALSWIVRRTDPTVTLDELVTTGSDRAVQESPDVFGRPEVTLLSALPADPGQAPDVTFVARDKACVLLTVTGQCPQRAGEVLVNEVDLAPRAVGDEVSVPRLGKQVIVGTYATPTTSDDWLLPSLLSSSPGSRLTEPRPAPYVVTTDAFASLPVDEQLVLLDSRLTVPDSLTDADLDAIVRQVDDVREARFKLGDEGSAGVLRGISDLNNLDTVLADVRSQRAAAGNAVAPAVVSLILVALAMILRLLSAAADLRVPELALAGLRGAGRRRTWLLGLAEPALILAIGTPLGLAVGYFATRGLVARWLRPDLSVELSALSLAAAAVVALAIAGAAVLAVADALRETLGDRLSGVRRPRPGSRTAVTVELVVVTAAIALPLAQLGVSDSGQGLDASTLLLPVVLAVAAGLLVTRAATLLTGAYARRRSGGSLSWFVAVRALSRRGQGTLVMLPVTSAIAVAVFAVGVSGAAADWRGSVSATRTPAPVVYSSPLLLDDTLALTRRLDPEGRWLMAAARTSVASGSLVLVDTERFADVVTWSDQWLPGVTVEDAQDLLAPDTDVVTLAGDDISLTVANDADERTPLTVRLEVYTPGVGRSRIYLGPYPAGTTTRRAASKVCDTGCDLRAITIGGGSVASSLPLHGSLVLTDLEVDGVAVAAALDSSGWDVETDEVVAGSTPRQGGVPALDLAVDTGTSAGSPTLTSKAFVAPIPVLVGTDVDETVTLDGGTTGLQDFGGVTPVDVVARPLSTPFLGPRGTVLDLVQADARLALTAALTTPYVLLAADTPPEILDGLADAGLSLDARAVDTRAELDEGAYAQALRLYQAVGAVILLMALGGLLVSLAVQVPARRRDAASLRVVGVSRRSVWLATWWESLVTLGGAAVAGLAAGLLAQVVLLRSLTLGVVEDRTTPPVVAAVDPGRVALVAVGITLVLLLVALGSCVVVLRRAGGATLRESAR